MPATCGSHSHGQSIPASFLVEQLSDLTNLSRPSFAETNHVSLVGYGQYNAYGAFATPSNYTYADNHPSTHFSNSNPSQWTDTTFGAGAAYDDGTAYTSEGAVTTGHPNNNTFVPFVNPNPSSFTGSTFPAGAAYHEGLTFQTAPSLHTSEVAVATSHLNNHAFAPFTDSNPSPFTGATFPAGAAYNGGTALPTAPMPYTWTPAASTGPMDPFMGAGFQYPDPTLPTTSPFTTAAATNANSIGNNYPGPFPAASLNDHLTTQLAAALEPPTAIQTVAHQAPQRPTCPQCAQSFTRKADLDRHAKKYGDDGDRYFCAVEGCAYGGSHRKDKLVEHVRRRHPGVRVRVGAVRRG